jgi:hypothetical protein
LAITPNLAVSAWEISGSSSNLPCEPRAARRSWSTAGSQVRMALHRAREALGGDPPSGPDWAVWVDHTELEIMSGRCWSTLGDHARAVPALECALDRYDDTHARDKALYLTWLASAHLDAGEVEQAAVVTGRALALCADVASVRPKDRIAAALQRLEAHRAVPAVADVVEQAEELLRRSPGSPSPGMPPSRRET